jgi:hypothetical protein
LRIVGVLASSALCISIVGAVAAPAQAAERTTAHTAAFKATKADRKYARTMHSSSNPDVDLYEGVSMRKLHNLGKADCKLIKAYDRSESAHDAVLDTLDYLNSGNDEYGTTNDGNAWELVAGIYSYCTKYVKTLDAM